MDYINKACPRGYYILDPTGDGNQWCPTWETVEEELRNKTKYHKVVSYDEKMNKHARWVYDASSDTVY